MKLFFTFLLLTSLLAVSGCKDKPVESFDVIVGENTVTGEINLSESFALNLDGDFPVNIKGKNYGEIYMASKNDKNPFRVGVTADFSIFTSETWDGFDSTRTLPNGDPIPGWVTPYELVRAGIPSFGDKFELDLYAGYYKIGRAHV